MQSLMYLDTHLSWQGRMYYSHALMIDTDEIQNNNDNMIEATVYLTATSSLFIPFFLQLL